MTPGEKYGVTLKEYIEAVMRENQRAIEQASAEREKAAAILRASLVQQLESGDKGLERHIEGQVKQIRELIIAQEEVVNQAQKFSQQAITKAEEAVERRLELLNEFRAQQADESKKYALRENVETLTSQVSKIWGGLIVVALVGVANLVKIFFVHT